MRTLQRTVAAAEPEKPGPALQRLGVREHATRRRRPRDDRLPPRRRRGPRLRRAGARPRGLRDADPPSRRVRAADPRVLPVRDALRPRAREPRGPQRLGDVLRRSRRVLRPHALHRARRLRGRGPRRARRRGLPRTGPPQPGRVLRPAPLRGRRNDRDGARRGPARRVPRPRADVALALRPRRLVPRRPGGDRSRPEVLPDGRARLGLPPVRRRDALRTARDDAPDRPAGALVVAAPSSRSTSSSASASSRSSRPSRSRSPSSRSTAGRPTSTRA